MKMFCVLFSFLLTGSSLLTAQTNSAPVKPLPAAPADLVVLHDVVTGRGGGRDLHAEVAYPKNATGLLPAIIYIHGGGWSGGTHKSGLVLQIAHAGYFAASIEYRLSGEALWPAQIQDCNLGVRWLRANAAKYNVDPNRIGAWGDSAGGHLVACLATMSDVKEFQGDGGYPGVSSAVQAVVDYYGPTDFVTIVNPPPKALPVVVRLFGATYDQNPSLWKSGSPIAYVKPNDPPILIVQGDSDSTVPMAQSTNFDAALTKVGAPHQLVIVKNAEHGFGALPGTTIDPSRADITKLTFAFFDKYLKSP